MQKDGEPSVEDILRSIKQVISRDDAQAGQDRSGADSAPADAPGTMPRPNASGFAPRDPFARTAFSPPPAAANTSGDEAEDVYDLAALPDGETPAEPEAIAPDDPVPLPAAFAAPGQAPHGPAPVGNDEPAERYEALNAFSALDPDVSGEDLISDSAASAVRERLATLSSLSAKTVSGESPTHPLEDVVRGMLRPMLKEWLDDNLETIIERIVSEEIARITGRR